MSILFVLGLLVFPSSSFAALLESDLQEYLAELGLTEVELEEHLDFYDSSLVDFEDIDELKEFLGPILTNENLIDLLVSYELTLEEATNLLIENGELEEGQAIIDVYLFVDDLDMDLYFYNLTPITDENLQQLLDQYELTIDDLNELLTENDDSLESYEYIEDLEWAIDFYLYGDDYLEEIDLELISDLFDEIGLTEEEVNRLLEHLESLDYEDPAFLEQLINLSDRMIAFEEFEAADELSAEQIAELIDIFTQLLDVLELDTTYYLVKDNNKEEVNLETLLTITEINGYSLLIEITNKQGDFLADFLFTAEMFGSEIIKETGKDLKTTEEVITKQKDTSSKSTPVTKTEKGAKLPKTATPYLNNALAGLFIVTIGLFLYRRFKMTGV
nr:processed acidic surface protein [Bacillus suaedae]